MRLLLLFLMLAAACAGEAGHIAAHGGSLNVLLGCDHGHAEVKVEGPRLRLWLVGGGNQTHRAVRSPDHRIVLQVSIPGQEPRPLILEAKPLALAEERLGDCSYFEGEAPWLAGLAAFTATGAVTVQGVCADLRVVWPEGYDPEHGHDHGHDHGHRP